MSNTPGSDTLREALEREAASLADYANECASAMTVAVLDGAASRLRTLAALAASPSEQTRERIVQSEPCAFCGAVVGQPCQYEGQNTLPHAGPSDVHTGATCSNSGENYTRSADMLSERTDANEVTP